MAEDALQWPMVGETYLEVVGCLGTALVALLGGDTIIFTNLLCLDLWGRLLDHMISCDRNLKISWGRRYQQALKSVHVSLLAKLVTSSIHPSFLNIGLSCPVCFV